MGELLVQFFEWMAEVVRPFSEAVVHFFTWLLALMVPAALGFGELALLLLYISAPTFIAYGVSRLVSRTTKKSMGFVDALFSTGLFAFAAAGALGSLFGEAISQGGVSLIVVCIWTVLTAGGFMLGSRKALGVTPAVVLGGLIAPLSMLAGLTFYAS